MPASARKSSISGRRGLQKAHIPYRGDNPEVGKKTGIAVQHVERKSDGFEPFEELMQRADGLTPPQKRGRKKSLASVHQQEMDYEEEDGEQSMQLDSPVQHLANMRPAITPPAVRRRSSIRPIAHTFDVDFDQIPSPRPMSSAQRNAGNRPGPSKLSKSTTYRGADLASDSPDEGGTFDYGEGDQDQNFEDYGPQENDTSAGDIPRQTSFSRINQDDDDQEEEEDQELTPKPSSRPGKGKGKEKSKESREELHEENEEFEDEIAQGLEDVDLQPQSDASQEERPVKKSKRDVEKNGVETASRKKKENKPRREGTRRSQRRPLKPLAWWRGERYVYGRKDDQTGPVLVPPIKEVIRIPEELPVPLGGKRKRTSSRPRSRSRGVEPDQEEIPPALPVVNPEEGWDDKTEAKCVVLRYTTREEVERRIAWTAKMVEPKMAADHNWSFDKIFGDDEFIAAGQLIIPPKGRKPSKAAKDNTYIFYVIEGAVNLKIHNTSMVLATGGMFMIPRGNTYFIENICNRDARLFFTQARKAEMNAEEKAAKKEYAVEMERRRLSGRSSSVGAPSTGPRVTLPPNGRAASLAAIL